MLTRPTLTEKIIRSLSALEEVLYMPRGEIAILRWIEQYPARSERRDRDHKKRQKRRVRRALKRLEKAKILSYSRDTQSYHLTRRGWFKYLYYYSRNKPSRPKRDKNKSPNKSKKHHLIIFDIPEAHRRFRDCLRQSLKNQGCRMLQKSVFACPNPEVFSWAKKVVCNCDLDGHVLFVEAEKVK